jgi:transcriptional regulator with XRE-family HTH domain
VDLSRQIKTLRQRDGLSQEDLAERIYVTRQTVSNWETERTYPDVQSLLLLSVLFDVSLDELVKGDIEMMKNELDVYRLGLYSWVMLACVVLACVAAFPLYCIFGLPGFGQEGTKGMGHFVPSPLPLLLGGVLAAFFLVHCAARCAISLR